ncbi:hypothetical protein [Luteibacter sp. UNCMF366Tsu5.1]|uniref:hypothetical protein n=1 Tax=Luteibacter sp. UNCMF366Tsu5.1 TaxID=1502758 RepID=UPI000908972A|nr:hypothetical protein [Luteibacter sp. UNCMF366Tsu5.1]SFW69918.1 hypothetical protein SAMN02800691_3059 [Luteibacter sp. UNCMF366Tsu5.1]
MNRFLDRLADLYAPLGRRGLLMDGQYRFAPDVTPRSGGRRARSGDGRKAGAATTGTPTGLISTFRRTTA